MSWTLQFVVILLTRPLNLSACDDCSGLPRWISDITGDGVVDESDDPCCYPHTWTLEKCMCDDEYERRHGSSKPEEDLRKSLYTAEDRQEPYTIVDLPPPSVLPLLQSREWRATLACGVAIWVMLCH